jgi:hypothetical protein
MLVSAALNNGQTKLARNARGFFNSVWLSTYAAGPMLIRLRFQGSIPPVIFLLRLV